ncbi:YciI family protein [Luteolibacter algae]|uniref:YciI family protein n=1 Tax=Luteolibacter algae TaxID=454151 RepID=A0ABW5D4F2_9BACT
MNESKADESKADYLLLFRNNSWYKDLSPDEIQRVMTDWMSWVDGLVAEGRCLGGQSLEQDGHVIRGAERFVTDGPYAESKESVAGYIILRVDSEDEALELAKLCPGLPYGATVEVRKLMERCGASQMAENPEIAKER